MECLIALAVIVAVAVPSLASMRGNARRRAETARNLAAVRAIAPLARSAGSSLRLGTEMPDSPKIIDGREGVARAVQRMTVPDEQERRERGERIVETSANGRVLRILALPPLTGGEEVKDSSGERR